MTAILRFLLLTGFIAPNSAHIIYPQNIWWDTFSFYKPDPQIAKEPAKFESRSPNWANFFRFRPTAGPTFRAPIKEGRHGVSAVPMAYMALIKQMKSAFTNDHFFH